MDFKIATIKLKDLTPNKGQVEGLPKNPRFIKDKAFENLVASIEEDPEMLDLREIIAYDNNGELVVIAGNQRYQALKHLKKKDAKVKVLSTDTPVEKLKSITIKDNSGYGEDDWDIVANEWGYIPDSWGLTPPVTVELDPEDLDEGFSLPDGEKEPFQSLTFKVSDEQAEVIKNEISAIQKTEDFKYCETFGNENSNGNALYLILATWAGQRI